MGAPVQSHLCVAESESGPKCPSPQAVCPQPHSACDKCGSSILQAGILPRPPLFCTNLSHPPEVGGHSALTAAESVSSFARWGRGASDPWPSQPPSPGAPGLVSPGDSELEMEASSLPSGHPLCFFPLGCWALFIGHIPPDYTDPPSPRPLLGGDHVSLSQPEFPQSLPRGPTLQ